MVRLQTLDLRIGVRVPASQPLIRKRLPLSPHARRISFLRPQTASRVTESAVIEAKADRWAQLASPSVLPEAVIFVLDARIN
jgi:hypothetical protein